MLELRAIQDVLYNIFRDGKTKYFQSSDAFENLAGDPYIRYEYFNGLKSKVAIWIGGNHIEETPIKICTTAKQIKNLVDAIIY